MHTMSLVHIVRQGCSMPSVLFFILAEQKNEQHTPIILFTPNICNESEGNLFVLNNLLSIFLFLDDETLLPCRLETTHIYYLEISFYVRLKMKNNFSSILIACGRISDIAIKQSSFVYGEIRYLNVRKT